MTQLHSFLMSMLLVMLTVHSPRI